MAKTAEVRSEVAGSVWKVLAAPGQQVGEGESIAILESMKMEIPVEAPYAGQIQKLLIAEGEPIAEGAVIAVISRD